MTYCQEIIKQGIGMVLLSMGGDGAVLTYAQGVYLARSPKVHARSTIGAGDTLLTCFLWGLSLGEAPDKALVRAVGGATAKVQQVGTVVPCVSQMEQCMQQVQMEQLI